MEMTIRIKGEGEIRVELWPNTAPIAVKSLKEMADKGKYDNRAIERLEPDFVIQPLFQEGMDPEIDRMIEAECKTRADNHALRFRRGIVGMAGDGEQASGSQFFLCLRERDYLQGNFTVVGTVIDGWDEIRRLEQVEVEGFLDPDSGRTFHVPKVPQVVESIRIQADIEI